MTVSTVRTHGASAISCCTSTRHLKGLCRILPALAVAAVLSSIPADAQLQRQRAPTSPQVETPAGTASAQARAEAMQAIPYRRLRPEVAKKIHAVVSQPTIFRRLPVTTVDCDPNLFVFLLRNPEVVVNIWDIMGVTQIDLQRRGPFHFTAHDGMGTTSQVELVYGTGNEHLYFGRGVYEGSLLKNKVFGECVMMLRSVALQGSDGRTKIRNVLDVFMKLDSATLELVMRTCQPLFVRAADGNFVETANFLMKLSRTAELNPLGVNELAGRLSDVQPQVRTEFAGIVNKVAASSRKTRLASSGLNSQRTSRTTSLVSAGEPKATSVSRRHAFPPNVVR